MEPARKRSRVAGVDPEADARETLRLAIEAAADEDERRFLSWARAEIDLDRYAALQRKHLKLRSRSLKFLDLATWLRLKYRSARKMGLARPGPLSILDIGCGPGHFELACRYLGHDILGLDVPGNALYADLHECFKLRVHLQPIRARQALPEALGRFDVVTAISANFYQKEDGSLFGVEDWVFFMRDLVRNHMNEGGRIYLKLNQLADRPGLHVADGAFASMMAARGGSVEPRTGVVEFASVARWKE